MTSEHKRARKTVFGRVTKSDVLSSSPMLCIQEERGRGIGGPSRCSREKYSNKLIAEQSLQSLFVQCTQKAGGESEVTES